MGPKDIKRVRLNLGWSQERLARELGVSFCTVNRWERGRTNPSPMAMRVLKKLRDKADMTNRRKTLRLNLRYPINIDRLEEAGSPIASQTEDISIGGLMFKAVERAMESGDIKIGDRLRIGLDLGGEDRVEAISEVVWARDKGGNRVFGVKFNDIPSGQRVPFMNTLLMNHPTL